MNGFDRYLEFQFRFSGDFYTALFQAIQLADEDNLKRLAKGFPEEVEAYKVWSRVGKDYFLQCCTDATPLKRKVLAGEFKL